jgi:hypothetical protein
MSWAILGKIDSVDKNHRVYNIPFSSVYPLYIQKAEKKGRTKDEVNQVIYWLTGHDEKSLQKELTAETCLADFYDHAPKPNPNRCLVKGVICGVRVEEIEDPTMREIRYLDKLIDELARGKAIDKILRQPT